MIQTQNVQTITLLGSTGSIGRSTLDVLRTHHHKFTFYALAAGSNVELLIEQVREFKPRFALLHDIKGFKKLQEACSSLSTTALSGADAIADIASSDEVDVVVSAIVGAAGLRPTLNAICAGKRVAIANKEPLVMAGSIMLKEAHKSGATILPIDSEHSAIFQSLVGSTPDEVAMIRLTASGGPFRGKSRSDLATVTREEALNHPTWDMGPKITIDSATLMNKALEVVEAHWLFSVPAEKIAVTIHPQSVIHSMVEYVDGSVMAQLGLPDMKVPIQYALSWPKRWPGTTGVPLFSQLGTLSFEDVDHTTFPSIELAWDTCRKGGVSGAVLNAANEVAVERFLNGEIKFLDIFSLVESITSKISSSENTPDLPIILEADAEARQRARVWNT